MPLITSFPVTPHAPHQLPAARTRMMRKEPMTPMQNWPMRASTAWKCDSVSTESTRWAA